MNSKIGGSLIIPQTSSQKELELEIRTFKSAGYEFAELQTKAITSYQEELKIVRNIIPFYSNHLPQIDYQKAEIERCKNYIGFLSDLGIRLFIIHLYSQNLPTKENLDYKIKSLIELVEFAESKKSTLTLENTEEDIETLKEIFDQIPNLAFCLDIGHANLVSTGSKSIDLIQQFGKILKHIHIHDNIGGDSAKHDIHLPIGEGNINFELIFESLKAINYSGNFTIELYKPEFEARKISIKRLKKLLV